MQHINQLLRVLWCEFELLRQVEDVEVFFFYYIIQVILHATHVRYGVPLSASVFLGDGGADRNCGRALSQALLSNQRLQEVIDLIQRGVSFGHAGIQPDTMEAHLLSLFGMTFLLQISLFTTLIE